MARTKKSLREKLVILFEKHPNKTFTYKEAANKLGCNTGALGTSYKFLLSIRGNKKKYGNRLVSEAA